MIGRTEWFTYRTFSYGIRPATKEGWLYSIIALILIVGPQSLTFLPFSLRSFLSAVFVIMFLIDMVHIWATLGKVHDERTIHHQLLIERNASFSQIITLMVTIFVVVVFLVYNSLTLPNPLTDMDVILNDPAYLVSLTLIGYSLLLFTVVGVVKTISSIYYTKKQ